MFRLPIFNVIIDTPGFKSTILLFVGYLFPFFCNICMIPIDLSCLPCLVVGSSTIYNILVSFTHHSLLSDSVGAIHHVKCKKLFSSLVLWSHFTPMYVINTMRCTGIILFSIDSLIKRLNSGKYLSY